MSQEEGRQEVEDLIFVWLKEANKATLMGRFFDVSKDEGKREFAEWFVGLIYEIDEFNHPEIDPEEE